MMFWSAFPGNAILTFLLSMVPVLELRFAIPIGVAHGLEPWAAVALAVIGNLLPVPFIILFIRKIFSFLRRISPKLDGFIMRLEQRAKKKSDTVLRWSFWGLFVLVAVPLPGTGAWTGALVAAMLDMRLKRAFPAIAMGVLAAGILVGLATRGVISFVL